MRVKSSMTIAEAMAALKVADKALQEPGLSPKDKRKAALAFARAERNARAAKRREVEGSILESLGGK